MAWTRPIEQLEHGERFGALTVLKRVDTRQGVKYRCGCSCGRVEHFRAKALMRADGVRECRRCAGPFKTANTTSDD